MIAADDVQGTEEGIMRTKAMVFGIIGGVIFLIWGIVGLFAGVLFGALAAAIGVGIPPVLLIGVLSCGLAVLGIVGGGMARGRPKVAGIFMLVAAAGAFAFAFADRLIEDVEMSSAPWIVAGIPLVVGGLLAIRGRNEEDID